MSRSGYSDGDDYEYLDLYRTTVDNAIAGKRGQKFLKEMLATLDAMPNKRLIAEELVTADGEVCAIGAVCKARGVDMNKIDAYNPQDVASAVGIATCLAAEIEYINDEDWRAPHNETPEQRWQRVRNWVASNILEPRTANVDQC